MSCFIKNIPQDQKIVSGNRGYGFPFDTCTLPESEICYIAVRDDGSKIVLNQENGEPVLLRCIE